MDAWVVRLGVVMLATMSLSLTSLAQPHDVKEKKPLPHLDLKGDPSTQIKLIANWKVPTFKKGEGAGAKMIGGPFRCSVCEADGQVSKEAALPKKAQRLGKRPADDVLAWWKDDMKLKPITIALEHSVMVIDLPPITSRGLPSEDRAWLEENFEKVKDPITPHQRAHLYALRYLQMEAQISEILCIDPSHPSFKPPAPDKHFGSKGRTEIYLFPKEEPYREFGRHFFGGSGPLTSWWYHPEDEANVAALHGASPNDQVLAARFDHQMAHHLIYQYRGFNELLPAWVTEGIGHWFERRHATHENTYCILGLTKDWKFDEIDWWSVVKDQINNNEDLPLHQLGQMTKLAELKPKHHPQAWSLTNFMLGIGTNRFRTFIDILKSRGAEESVAECHYRAIETAYECDLVTFQKAWRKWAMATRSGRR